MSKRFGRNRRRKMREQLEALQTSRETDWRLLATYSKENRRLIAEIYEAKRIVGEMSPLFTPEVQQTYLDKTDRLRWPKRPSCSFVPVGELVSYQQSEYIPLDALVSYVSEDEWDKSIHFRAEFRDGSYGYVVSQKALRDMPLDVLIERIARELAIQIAREMKR